MSSDDRAALSWFKTAAAKGQSDAMWMLGRMYYDGRGGGGAPDYDEALKWFEKSASLHNFRGQFYMGASPAMLPPTACVLLTGARPRSPQG